jgi:putative ABC transport system substrate-binding protein
LSNVKEDTAGKEVEFLKTAAPQVARIAVLTNPTNPSHAGEWRGALEAAQALRVELIAVEVRGRGDIDPAFVTMAGAQVDGVVVLSDALFFAEAGHIADGAARVKLPAIYGFREHVLAGGLMSYGPDIKDSFRRVATYVDKILKGANPAELPIEQPTKFELVI